MSDRPTTADAFRRAFIDFFDLSGIALFVEGPRQIYAWMGLPVWLSTFLADGVGGGVRLPPRLREHVLDHFLRLERLGQMRSASENVTREWRS